MNICHVKGFKSMLTDIAKHAFLSPVSQGLKISPQLTLQKMSDLLSKDVDYLTDSINPFEKFKTYQDFCYLLK